MRQNFEGTDEVPFQKLTTILCLNDLANHLLTPLTLFEVALFKSHDLFQRSITLGSAALWAARVQLSNKA